MNRTVQCAEHLMYRDVSRSNRVITHPAGMHSTPIGGSSGRKTSASTCAGALDPGDEIDGPPR